MLLYVQFRINLEVFEAISYVKLFQGKGNINIYYNYY